MVVNKMDIAAYSIQFKFYASFLFMLASRCHHIRDIQENTRHNLRGRILVGGRVCSKSQVEFVDLWYSEIFLDLTR